MLHWINSPFVVRKKFFKSSGRIHMFFCQMVRIYKYNLDKYIIKQCYFTFKMATYNLLDDGLFVWLIDRLNGWLVGWPVDWLIDWLFDCLIDWLIDWLIEWLIDRLIDWLIIKLVSWADEPTCSQVNIICFSAGCLSSRRTSVTPGFFSMKWFLPQWSVLEIFHLWCEAFEFLQFARVFCPPFAFTSWMAKEI